MALNIVLVEPEIPQNTGNIARSPHSLCLHSWRFCLQKELPLKVTLLGVC